ncbi:hypothetical protein AU476_11640 [Cupriavidus sp. UYMSc13B]|nr:hypothetical protein AU476_11640 [Cupriavidus sp. UYMSc13B]
MVLTLRFSFSAIWRVLKPSPIRCRTSNSRSDRLAIEPPDSLRSRQGPRQLFMHGGAQVDIACQHLADGIHNMLRGLEFHQIPVCPCPQCAFGKQHFVMHAEDKDCQLWIVLPERPDKIQAGVRVQTEVDNGHVRLAAHQRQSIFGTAGRTADVQVPMQIQHLA